MRLLSTASAATLEVDASDAMILGVGVGEGVSCSGEAVGVSVGTGGVGVGEHEAASAIRRSAAISARKRCARPAGREWRGLPPPPRTNVLNHALGCPRLDAAPFGRVYCSAPQGRTVESACPGALWNISCTVIARASENYTKISSEPSPPKALHEGSGDGRIRNPHAENNGQEPGSASSLRLRARSAALPIIPMLISSALRGDAGQRDGWVAGSSASGSVSSPPPLSRQTMTV